MRPPASRPQFGQSLMARGLGRGMVGGVLGLGGLAALGQIAKAITGSDAAKAPESITNTLAATQR